MPTEVPLRCRCGQVRGIASEVSPAHGNRIICYCDDCQAFARFLGPSDILDSSGGSDIYQVAPARIRLTQGLEAVRCVRLSDKGMHRWYADCCRTPIANTLDGGAPFVGIARAFMDHAGEGRPRDEVLGKPLAFIYARYATGEVPAQAHPKMPYGFLARAGFRLVKWWISGVGSPSPFFDPQSRAPIVVPQILTPEERAALAKGISPG